MNLKLQRRLAAEVLKVGENRIWIDPTKVKEVKKAITKGDIKALINKGVIKAKPKRGVSRARARMLHEKRKKGRRRGHGSRKGAKKARTPKKEVWMAKVRLLRAFLKRLKEKGIIDTKQFRQLYLKVKGNFFRSKAHLKMYIEKMVKE